MTVSIRRAAPADYERVREITVAAKAHWGYDLDFVRGWVEGLTFASDRKRGVAEADGTPVVWAALLPPEDGACILDDLWVEPAWMGQGLGTRLFRVAANGGRAMGATALEWSAEPNAVGFYEKMGGWKLRDHVTEWGWVVPWMGIDL